MHHIYHTHSFILKSKNISEANKLLTIYTRELGLVRAVAQGVRLEKSKNRFALQDFSYANIDLVKGKDVWRVASTKTVTSFPFAKLARENLLLISRVSSLIERLCVGEYPYEKIFDDLIQGMYSLDDSNLSFEIKEAMELHLVLRIVHSLGYIGDSKILNEYLGNKIDKKLTKSLLSNRKYIVSHINKAIRESQL